MPVVLVYLQPFRHNSLLKCALQPKIAKNYQNPSFVGSWLFKVIDVDKSKKPVTITYDMQQVCTYLQPFSHYNSQMRQNNVFRGVPLFDVFVQEKPLHTEARNFVTKN